MMASRGYVGILNMVQFVIARAYQSLFLKHPVPNLGGIILMEHQSPDLDALSGRDVLAVRVRVHKRRVRDPPRPPVRLCIKALDQQHLLGRQAALVVPAVRVVVPNLQRLAAAGLRLGVDEACGDKVCVGHGVGVRDGEGVALHGRDGPPDVDDLHPALEQLVRLVREVVRHPRERGRVGLVYVHPLDRTPARGLGASVRGQLAADRVVKDEDPGRAGPVADEVGQSGVRGVRSGWGACLRISGTYTSLSSCSVSL